MSGRDTIEAVTARLIERIEAGALQGRMLWSGTNLAPHNATTYRGGNVLALWVEAQINGYTSPAWATYKQWQTLGAQVRRGSTGTQLIRWVPKQRRDSDGEPRTDDNGQPLTFLVPVTFVVFNHDQVDHTNTDDTNPPVAPVVDSNLAAAIDAVPAVIRWGAGSPCYLPALDEVRMPDPDAFNTVAACHAVLAHELAHWTGHTDRLNRDHTGRFGDHAYAIEELTAELSAAFTCSLLGIDTADRYDDHAHYFDHWLTVLRSDPAALWTIASAAQDATDHLLAYSTQNAEDAA